MVLFLSDYVTDVFSMISLLYSTGTGADRLPEILNPATSNVISSRMAANLANYSSGSIRERGEGREDDSAFWTAVRRFFDEKIKRGGERS